MTKKFDFAENKKRYEILDWEAFAAEFTPKLHKPFAKAVDQLTEIVVFRADKNDAVLIAGDLVIDCTSPNVVIDGDAVVDGSVIMSVDEGFGQFLVVTGNLRAKSICLDGFPEMEIRGDVECANGIVCIQGDDGGFLDILGNVTTPVFIDDTYFNVSVKGKISGVTINTADREFAAQYTLEDVHKALRAEFLEMEEGDEDEKPEVEAIKSEKILNAVRNGKPVLLN